MTTRFDTKDPGEEVTLGFDFSRLGIPASPAIEITVRVGEDPNPTAMLVGSAFISAGWVYQRIAGGIDGVDYAVRCFARIGADLPLIDAILPVRRRPAP